VIPVPDSGNPAARGYARASGLPQDDGFVKNRYVQRTFIQPGQELRKHGLRLKFNPLPEVVAGKRLVVVDDSIVRGNTTAQIVGMLRAAGAAEIHMRITAPPIKHPCHYGIDMSTREEMIAHERTVAEVAAELGCDSLAYLSLAGVYEAVGGTRERHCDACFTGEYPLEGTEDALGKDALERRRGRIGGRRAGPCFLVRAPISCRPGVGSRGRCAHDASRRLRHVLRDRLGGAPGGVRSARRFGPPLDGSAASSSDHRRCGCYRGRRVGESVRRREPEPRILYMRRTTLGSRSPNVRFERSGQRSSSTRRPGPSRRTSAAPIERPGEADPRRKAHGRRLGTRGTGTIRGSTSARSQTPPAALRS
jgi:hypothetical protein